MNWYLHGTAILIICDIVYYFNNDEYPKTLSIWKQMTRNGIELSKAYNKLHDTAPR